MARKQFWFAMPAFLLAFSAWIGLAPSSLASAEARGQISGRVIAHHNQKPIVGATIELLERRLITRTDGRGRFTFDDLDLGIYHLTVSTTGYANAARVVQVHEDNHGSVVSQMTFELDLLFHDHPVLVTASATPEDKLQVYQPTSILGTEELEKRAAGSLGATLQNEAGITASSSTTASARPVIRGLGGDRVLILEDGTRTGDLSAQSSDHAVTVDTAGAEGIEVVRGPANLLYGSNATGGVINVINGDVPSRIQDEPTGAFSLASGTNAQEISGTARLDLAAGPVAFTLGGTTRQSEGFKFRGGEAGNSQTDFSSVNGGASFVGSKGYIGAAIRKYEGEYGIPVSEDGELVSPGQDGVVITVDQRSYKLRGEITHPFGLFEGARFQAARREFEQTEFEDTGDVGTLFKSDTTEIRSDLTHNAIGKLHGSFGFWLFENELEATGEEARLARARTEAYAGFFYEEIDLNKAKILVGGRYDTFTITQEEQSLFSTQTGNIEQRKFSSVTGAVGAILNPEGRFKVSGNISRNFRSPSAEELFSNGPHPATFAFELGDPDLARETSLGGDLSFHWRGSRFAGEITAFRTEFKNFIFLEPILDASGQAVIDPNLSDLPQSMYTQAGAVFYGAEAHADINILNHLTTEIRIDFVHADNSDLDEPLPRIPPFRTGVGLTWDTDRFSMGGEARYTAEQTRTAPGELPTSGFMVYNAMGQLSITTGGIIHRFVLRLENVTNRFHRNHVSLVKHIVPEPGRNGRLAYTVLF